MTMKTPLLDTFETSPSKAEQMKCMKLFESAIASKTPGQALEEGLLGGIAAGISAAALGPALMKSVCAALGIPENGTLGKLLTSKLVLASVAGLLGLKL